MNEPRRTPSRARPWLRLAAAAACAVTLAACSPGAPVAGGPGAAGSGGGVSAGASAASAAASPAPSGTPVVEISCPTPPDAFVNSAPGEGKTVALTFDDGPAPADAAILDVLREEGVKATFFVTGEHAQADPETVRRMVAEGHLIAGHSWEHRYPKEVSGGWSIDYLTGQLDRTHALLTELTGQTICYFRPPGGNKDNVLAASAAAGITSVMWNVDSEDWQQPGRTTAAATKLIVSQATASPGTHPVVLLHSGKASHEPDTRYSPYRGNTVAALPTIIDWYRAEGYTFVRLDAAD